MAPTKPYTKAFTTSSSSRARRKQASDEEAAGYLLSSSDEHHGSPRSRHPHRSSSDLELDQLRETDPLHSGQPSPQKQLPPLPSSDSPRRSLQTRVDPRSTLKSRRNFCASRPPVIAIFVCSLLLLVFLSLAAILLGYFDPSLASPSSLPSLASPPRAPSYPTSFSRDILPLPLHSHNDYWRAHPLFTALSHGCVSVEADIWAFPPSLLVGHSLSSLTPSRSLTSLYIDPLVKILDSMNPSSQFTNNPPSSPNGVDPSPSSSSSADPSSLNGVFDTSPTQTLTLLIDLKDPTEAFSATVLPLLRSALAPLRKKNYLSLANATHLVPGPVTVVLTGNTPFDALVGVVDGGGWREMFFDAPLGGLVSGASEARGASGEGEAVSYEGEAVIYEGEASRAARGASHEGEAASYEPQTRASQRDVEKEAYSTLNSFYASTYYLTALGPLSSNGTLDAAQVATIRAQISAAHRLGLKARYWGVPEWGPGVWDPQDGVWAVLGRELDLRAGGDVLSVDALGGFRAWGGGGSVP